MKCPACHYDDNPELVNFQTEADKFTEHYLLRSPESRPSIRVLICPRCLVLISTER